MKKRVFNVVIALALCLGLLPGKVRAAAAPARTAILDLSAAESSDKLNDEGWKWDVLGNGSYKLTLQNFFLEFTNTDNTVPNIIILPKGTEGSHPLIEIELHGTNAITVDIANEAPGSLISATHSNITVCGDGSLQITANETQPKAYVFGANALTIQSGTVSSNVGLGHLTEDFTVNGGTLSLDTRPPPAQRSAIPTTGYTL